MLINLFAKVVIVPDEIKHTSNASMWITGGGMGSSPPSADSEDILVSAALACSVGTITAVLFQIPNEHITFAADPIQKSRTEDAVIAFTVSIIIITKAYSSHSNFI